MSADKFSAAGLDKWRTGEVTTLFYTFFSAINMNVDVQSWDVSRVNTLYRTFFGAAKFVGTGLETWKTGSVTSLYGTFYGAGNMNGNLNGWDVSNVKTMEQAFYNAVTFVGAGIETWSTGSVTSLLETFCETGLTDVNLGGWDVSKVGTMYRTFRSASKFEGAGIDKWITGSVTTLFDSFRLAAEFNANVGGWDVSKVGDLSDTFNSAVKFTGAGLATWKTGSVTTMVGVFNTAREMDADLGNWDVSKVSNSYCTL
jgi:hypothetical protein